MGDTPKVSERQKKYEDSCREIGNDLKKQLQGLPLSDRLLAVGNLIDLFACIRQAYLNGRADEKEAAR